MMSAGKPLLVTALTGAVLSGCILIPPDTPKRAPPAGFVDHLAVLEQTEQPLLRIATGAERDLRRFKQFSVAPATCTMEGATPPKSSAAPLFALRNQLEARGYAFAPTAKQGFIALLEYTPQPRGNKSGFIFRSYPPRETVLDDALPSPLAALVPNIRQRCDGNMSFGRAPMPGSLQTAPVDPYYPTLRVTLFDRNDGNAIWIGEAIGFSREADPGLSSQWLLRNLIRQIPVADALANHLSLASGHLGFAFVVASTDGSRFRPVVSHVAAAGPAAEAGLFKGDVITAIDGASTLNLSTSTISALLAGEPGQSRHLTIDRLPAPAQLEISYRVRPAAW